MTPFRRALAAVSSAAATILALGCGGAAPAPANPEPAAATEPARSTGPLLWRVEGESGPSYLLGTIHLGVSVDTLGPGVGAALNDARVYISEVDLTKVSRVELLGLAMLPDGERLEAAIGAESFAELVGLLAGSLGRAEIDRLRPWFAYSSVLQTLYASGSSMDDVLASRAAEAGKPMVFLETWQFQLGLLADIIDAGDLKAILDPDSKDRATMGALIDAYRRGDLDAVTGLLASPEVIAEDPQEWQALFEDRNRAWLPTLEAELRRGGAFVAVGAGHFVGDVGLVALLKSAGIEAVRVSP